MTAADYNYIVEYQQRLVGGQDIAGQEVHEVLAIIAEDLQQGAYIYDPKKAHKAVTFIEKYCRHSKGRRGLLKLEPWQKAIVAAIFGLVDEGGLRFYREVLIVVARKNGKSLLAAAISAYMAYIDDEYGGEIYFLATKKDQTKHVWTQLVQIVKKEPALAKRTAPDLLSDRAPRFVQELYIEKTNTQLTPLVFNPDTSDGFNFSLAVNDEVHAWPGNRGLRMYSVMKSGMGARKQPILLSITTAGSENEGIYDNLIKRSTDFLNHDSAERRLLPWLFRIDDPDKWDDIEEVKKANPNIGVSVPVQYFIDEIALAKEDLNSRREMLMKYCNVKQSQVVAWIDNRLLEECVNKLTLDDFRGCYGVGGIDLSQTVDLTAASAVIERDGILYTFCHFFMPKERFEKAIIDDNAPYDIYLKQGLLTLSGDNAVNYRDVYDWFTMIHNKHKIYLLKIGYDRQMARYLVDDLAGYGFHMDDVFQGDNLAPIIRELQGTIRDGGFIIAENNHLLKAHFLNVALKHNLERRSFRAVKIQQRKRIDGFVAAICALTVRHKYMGEVGEFLKNKGR